MDWRMPLLTCIAAILASLNQITAKSILLLPGPAKNNVRRLTSIGEGLIKKGHEVIVALHKDFNCPESSRKLGMIVNQYGHHGIMRHGVDQHHLYHSHFLSETLRHEFQKLEGAVWGMASEACTSILADLVLLKKLRDAKLDFILVDGNYAFRCLYIIPHKLGVPYGSFTDSLPTDLVSTLMTLPSYHPHQMSMDCRSPIMDFYERLTNSLEMVIGVFYIYFKTEDSAYRQYSQEKPYTTLRELAEESVLWIVDIDPIFDFPYPTMPNLVYSGGIDLKERPLGLSRDMETFMNSALYGVIVVTFGNGLRDIPNHHADKMATAFGRIRERVVWRNQGNPTVTLSENVKIMDMIPLEALLHHPNTKLFISHCGPGGQNEAIFHGVPMIAFPVTGEQLYNAMRLEMKGIGIKLEFLQFTPDELVNTIKEITERNTTYSQTAKKYSQMLKDRPYDVHETVMFWIEHVIQYGGEHMRSVTSRLTWYQLMLYDVTLFVLFAAVLVTIVTFYLVFIFLKCCYRVKGILFHFVDDKIKIE